MECRPYIGSSYGPDFAAAPIEFMSITEDESQNTRAWGQVNWALYKEFGINMKFIIIPNGHFLPVPYSHYHP